MAMDISSFSSMIFPFKPLSARDFPLPGLIAYLDNSWRCSHHSNWCAEKPGHQNATFATASFRSKANATQMAEKAEKKASEAEQDHRNHGGSHAQTPVDGRIFASSQFVR